MSIYEISTNYCKFRIVFGLILLLQYNHLRKSVTWRNRLTSVLFKGSFYEDAGLSSSDFVSHWFKNVCKIHVNYPLQSLWHRGLDYEIHFKYMDKNEQFYLWKRTSFWNISSDEMSVKVNTIRGPQRKSNVFSGPRIYFACSSKSTVLDCDWGQWNVTLKKSPISIITPICFQLNQRKRH